MNVPVQFYIHIVHDFQKFLCFFTQNIGHLFIDAFQTVLGTVLDEFPQIEGI